MLRLRVASLTLAAALLTAAPAAAAPRIGVKDLLKVKWINQLTLSPDGKRAAFVVQTHDYEKNKKVGHIWMVFTRTGGLRQLTNHEQGESSPAFSPDGNRVAFVSSRGGDTAQIWLISAHGGEARQLTRLSTGAWGPIWSPDGKMLAFVSSVYSQCTGPRADACNKKLLDKKKQSKVKARVIDALLYRHWNSWRDARREHVFVVPAAGGQPRDLTPGPHDAPPISLGGYPDYDFSPDGKTLAYTSNTDKVVATSTNNDVFVVPVAGGKATRISRGKGNDNTPRFSPDGRYLAYLSMARAGYESDRPRLMVRDLKSGKQKEWTRGFTLHPYELLWGPDSKRLYFNATRKGFLEIFSATSSGVKRVSDKRYAKYLNVTRGGERLVFTHEAADRAPEVHIINSDGSGERALTSFNTWFTKKGDFQAAEHHWFAGAAGDRVHAVLIKPPGFRRGRKYPAMVMIHGGPQGMTGDSFHPRWNLQMFASRGYVIFGINFHGSTGFGQAFTDSIRGDWGGKPYRDILKGTEYLARLPYVKPRQICAAGASYGGYMINWIATHSGRFNCLISHAGLFNMESKYGSTDELWFPEWDFKGTPWTNRALFRKLSPHSYAEKIKTPTLVIHGERDFRVPVAQGFQMFTALQRQGVPSRLLYFPDEDHFVQKPQNIELWWNTMHDWLGRYLR
jgi:dipeptidyl aminopeptidase/acylaminoacyl peptidase